MLFDADAQRDIPNDVGDPIDTAFGLIRDHISGLEARAALARIHRYQSELSALETRVVASVTKQTGNDRAAKRMLRNGKRSRSAIAKAAARGGVAAANSDLIDKVADGDISEEHLDVIAETAAKTDGVAATDDTFIDDITSVDPDQARGIADKFIADHATRDGVRTEHKRQRALRRGSRYTAKASGLDTISLQGDGSAVEQMWSRIRERANELYQADGGRDEAGNHARTHEQRMFDAAYEILCGVTTTAAGVKHQPRHSGGSDGSGSGSRPARPQIFVGLTLDNYLGNDRAAMATQIGVGLIPDSVLAEYLEHADVFGLLYDGNGQPLWIGRAKRHASLMQRYALIARDQACVQCGADHQSCEVHHLTPWNAPAKGRTDLDQLVLLCPRCHRTLHGNNETLFQDRGGNWRTRPATADETPPQPISYPQRE